MSKVRREHHAGCRHHGRVEHAHGLRGASRRNLAAALVLIVGYMIAEIIGILILVSSWRLLGKVIHVLLQGVPQHVDIGRLCKKMGEVLGVGSIHDIHVWSLASGYDVLTAHVLVDPEVENVSFIRNRLREIALRDFGIRHVTLQLEDTAEDCIDENHDVGDTVAPRAAEGLKTD